MSWTTQYKKKNQGKIKRHRNLGDSLIKSVGKVSQRQSEQNIIPELERLNRQEKDLNEAKELLEIMANRQELLYKQLRQINDLLDSYSVCPNCGPCDLECDNCELCNTTPHETIY